MVTTRWDGISHGVAMTDFSRGFQPTESVPPKSPSCRIATQEQRMRVGRRGAGTGAFRCRYATQSCWCVRSRGLKPTAIILHRYAVGRWMRRPVCPMRLLTNLPHANTVCVMKILPPSEKLRATNEALARRPQQPLSVEKAREQVKEHLAEAQAELLRLGRVRKRPDLAGLSIQSDQSDGSAEVKATAMPNLP